MGRHLTRVCSQPLTASAPTSLPLPAAAETWRWYDFRCQEWATDCLAFSSSSWRRPLEEAEPGRDDGWSCGSPWDGAHLPCLRRVSASLAARGVVATAERQRGFPHTGAASRPMAKPSRGTTSGARWTVSLAGGRGSSWARAHRKALQARALATPTWSGGCPRALSCRARVPSRPWAGPLRAWLAGGTFARRRGSWRRLVAGEREAQAPAIRARRAWGARPAWGPPAGAARPGRMLRGFSPRHSGAVGGVAQRVRAPRAATVVTATVHGPPRQAGSASPTGVSPQWGPWSWREGTIQICTGRITGSMSSTCSRCRRRSRSASVSNYTVVWSNDNQLLAI